MTKPPSRKHDPRRHENKKLNARLQRASNQADRYSRQTAQPCRRRVGLTPRGAPSQRERERERRVSDADASDYGHATGTATLEHVDPQRMHAKYNSLSEATRSLSQGPRQTFRLPATKTDQNPTLCLPDVPRAHRGTEQYKRGRTQMSIPPLWGTSRFAGGAGRTVH